MWRCCCCCRCLIVGTIEKLSRTIQACRRKGNKLARTGRESSPGPFAGNLRRRTTRQFPTVPGAAKKAKKVRACAIETHFNIKPKQASRSRTEVDTSLSASLRGRNTFQHQAKARICGTYHAKRSRTEVNTSLCASLRSRNALRHQARARICGTYHAKRSRTEVDTSLCASLRSRNALRHQARARICGTYHAKRSRTEVDTSLCASLRSRNALRHQARARICGTYHAKRSRTERAPQSGTKAFFSYRKNPLV